MNEISKEILEKYQIRKTRKQKTAFIEFLRAHYPNLKIEEDAVGYSRNIVIGNPDTAKAVFGAHYDTCAMMPFAVSSVNTLPSFMISESSLPMK